MGVGSGGQGGTAHPTVFFHGTSRYCRGLIVLLSVFFCYFAVFFRCPPTPSENFSVDALGSIPALFYLIYMYMKKKWPFRGAKFFPTNLSYLKSYQKYLIGWKNPALIKVHICCEQVK